MNELRELISWLASQRGNWTRISQRSGISTRTIYRIVNDPEYNVTRATIRALTAEQAAAEQTAA
jgi:hypothetical protein